MVSGEGRNNSQFNVQGRKTVIDKSRMKRRQYWYGASSSALHTLLLLYYDIPSTQLISSMMQYWTKPIWLFRRCSVVLLERWIFLRLTRQRLWCREREEEKLYSHFVEGFGGISKRFGQDVGDKVVAQPSEEENNENEEGSSKKLRRGTPFIKFLGVFLACVHQLLCV